MSDEPPNITVQGDFHASDRDSRAIVDEHGLENYDVLFVEGRDEDIIVSKSPRATYLLFLIGYLTLGLLIYLPSRWLRRRVPFVSQTDLEAEANDVGIDFDDEPDLQVHEIYGLVKEWKWRLRLALILPLLLLGLGMLIVMDQQNPDLTGAVLFLLSVVSVPFSYLAAVLSLVSLRDYSRDEVMAEYIANEVDDNGYDDVILLCGERHAPGIEGYFQDRGWKVDRRKSWFPLRGFVALVVFVLVLIVGLTALTLLPA